MIGAPSDIHFSILYALSENFDFVHDSIIKANFYCFFQFLPIFVSPNTDDFTCPNGYASIVCNNFDLESRLELGSEGDIEAAVVAVA